MENNNNNNNKISVSKLVAVIEAVVIAAAAIVFGVFIAKKKSPETVTVSTPSEENNQSEDDTYTVDGSKIFLDDDGSEIHIFPDVPRSDIESKNLTIRNGKAFYTQDGGITSYLGIDVSDHNGGIDWLSVKNAGIDFAMIRIGYMLYESGEIVMDTNYAYNLQAAYEAGIKTGVYFFSQAVSKEEALEEAELVINAINGYNIPYPVVFDWETVNAKTARTNDVTVDTLAECCIAFCERVKEAGYTPMIYQNKDTAMRKLDLPRLKDYDFWLAEYDDKPTYRYYFDMWQYGQNGYIPGIEGDVDMNIAFHDYGGPLPEVRTETPTAPPVYDEETPPAENVENYDITPAPGYVEEYEQPVQDYQENYYEEPYQDYYYQDYGAEEYYPPAEEYYPENDYQW
ncbi:MAG: glycoside hydrolase family 25 protein [Ruminococcus sp.]|nr:glycoside hydrolase family 25 protein [Ruminococcus sp.]